MKDRGGRPREYASQAERQAAYRARKAEEGMETVKALARLRQAIRWARRRGQTVTFPAEAVDTEHEDSTMLYGLSTLITGRASGQKLL